MDISVLNHEDTWASDPQILDRKIMYQSYTILVIVIIWNIATFQNLQNILSKNQRNILASCQPYLIIVEIQIKLMTHIYCMCHAFPSVC